MHRSRRAVALLTPLALLALASPAGAQPLQPPPPMQPAQPQPTQPIAPPPPMAPSTGPGQQTHTNEQQQAAATTKKLDESESKDSGRNFELFYLDGSIGGSYINMSQFSADKLAIEQTSAGGPAFSVGAGIRLVVFVAGARLRYNALSSFNLVQLNGEIGLKLPLSQFDILIGLHGGYSFVGRLGDTNQATSTSTPTSNDAVSIRGFNAGLEFGFDYYVSPLFSVGAGVLADFLLLNRPPVDIPQNVPPEQRAAIEADPLYKESGTSAGLALGGGLRLGLHFGL